MPNRLSRRELSRIRQAQALAMHHRSYSQAEIARELGISQQAVSKLLRRAKAAQEGGEPGAAARLRVEGMLETLISEALAAARRSSQPLEAARTTKTAGGKGVVPARDTGPDPTGDPRFLAIARGAVADLRDLLGLSTPKTPKPARSPASKPRRKA